MLNKNLKVHNPGTAWIQRPIPLVTLVRLSFLVVIVNFVNNLEIQV